MVGPKKVLLLCEGRAWYVEPSRALPLVGPNPRPRPCGARAPRPGDICPIVCPRPRPCGARAPRPGDMCRIVCSRRPGGELAPSEKVTTPWLYDAVP